MQPSVRPPMSIFVVLLLSLGACTTLDASKTAPAQNRNFISTAEMQLSMQVGDAYSLVQRIRPLWLHKRGRSSIMYDGDIWVYLDNMRLGPPSELRSISTSSISSLEFLDPSRAQMRYGLGHGHGVILIHTLPDRASQQAPRGR